MINIRYHVYSLVAVFLALAIGVAAGSTVVQRSVVDNLRSTQGRIEQNLDELEAQNAELQERTGALEGREGSLIDEGPAALLAGKLTGQPLVLLRTEGTPGGAVDRVRDVLEVAGAEVVADVELRAAVNDPEVLADGGLRARDRGGERRSGPAAGSHRPAARGGARRRPRRRGFGTTVRRAAPRRRTDHGGAGGRDAVELEELLRQLDDLGVLSFRGPLGEAGVTTAGADLLVLGGLTTDMDPVPFLDGMLSLVAADAVPMAVAADAALDEPPPEGEEALGIVPTVRGDGRLRDAVTTVDHVADFAGLSALVLGLADLDLGQVGHFGVDDGADSVLPPRRS